MGLAASLFFALAFAVDIWGMSLDYKSRQLLNAPFPWRWWAIQVFPHSLLLLLAAVPTALLWYVDRRFPRGHCRRCGYDLTGNVSGVCPECGEKV
jgi:hypothetical protein